MWKLREREIPLIGFPSLIPKEKSHPKKKKKEEKKKKQRY